ncbi:hypothetical protein CCR75_006363 [Bremia lactucae]|uniref:RRM domain-containing protein n=1 Tax=Bremia lactucae TaxID=4779 RepID=A0A976NZW8_BRELC|nr:hypothetical protein CCR75_006363 [Bremia lactucae]
MTDTTKLGKIFIGGLSYETTDGTDFQVQSRGRFTNKEMHSVEKLRSYFGTYGIVTDAVVMKDPITRRSRGFGFITYADPLCVDRALAQPNHILDSRRVEAKRAVPRAESLRDIGTGLPSSRPTGSNSLATTGAHGATKKIFVGGLHYETKDADFKQYFSQYGKVVSAEVMFNRETNKSRGFGFVIFENETSVELVLQEKNHVIDSKSVEVKRAVPRTDVPPPRSISSRGDSFSGPSGPGSIGSMDELSTTTTPPVSLSGSVPSSSGFVAAMRADKFDRGGTSSANLMPNGMLSGYAAAVRYGSLKSPNAMLSSKGVSSPRPRSCHGDLHTRNGIALDTCAISGVADALSSLVLGDGLSNCGIEALCGGTVATSPPLSAGSSRGSSDQIMEAVTRNGHMSPLDVAYHPLNNDPVIEQWRLSPNLGPQLSPRAPLGSPSKSGFLPHGIVDTTTEHTSSLSWQATPWQHQSWGSSPLSRGPQQPQQPPLPPAPAPLFSIFSNQCSGGTSLDGSSPWPTNSDATYSSNKDNAVNDGFGHGMMGIGLSIDTGFGLTDNGRSAFGISSENDNVASYSSLSSYLKSEYRPADQERHHQDPGSAKELLESVSFGDMMTSDVASDADELRKEAIFLDYDVPSSAAEYRRQYR